MVENHFGGCSRTSGSHDANPTGQCSRAGTDGQVDGCPGNCEHAGGHLGSTFGSNRNNSVIQMIQWRQFIFEIKNTFFRTIFEK